MRIKDIQNTLGVITAGLICLSGSVTEPSTPPRIDLPNTKSSAYIARNDALKQELDVESFNGDKTYTPTGRTILTDEDFLNDLTWMTYDNIPEPYHEQLLSEFETRYKEVITNTTITDSAYRSLPTPVRHANLLHRINEHVEDTTLPNHYESPEAATKAIGATIMTESFFNQDATHPARASMKIADVGYGQVSRWTREHFHETQGFPAPEDSTWFNAETQVDFITSWYEKLHNADHPNAVAIAAYNTGKTAAMNRENYATSYYATWHDRHTRYFDDPESQTQQWILDQAGLQ
jgi:hypothetical protein